MGVFIRGSSGFRGLQIRFITFSFSPRRSGDLISREKIESHVLCEGSTGLLG